MINVKLSNFHFGPEMRLVVILISVLSFLEAMLSFNQCLDMFGGIDYANVTFCTRELRD